MTSSQLLGILRNRWYVVVVGIALTMFCLLAVRAQTGVYSAGVEVRFLIPQTARYPNNIQTSSAGAVAMAGLVETALNGTNDAPAAASSGVTMPGQGIERGSSITLPDSGGQWAHNFSRPVLLVEAVGPTAPWVQREIGRQVHRINRELALRQTTDGVRGSDWITTSVTPTAPDVYYLAGHHKYALTATAALGLWLTMLSALAVDRARTVAQRRRRAATPEPALAGAKA